MLKKIMQVFFLISLFFAIGYFACEMFYNRQVREYEVHFNYDGQLDIDYLLSEEYLLQIKESKTNYNKINVSKMLAKDDISITFQDESYILIVKAKYFSSLANSRGFIKTALTNLDKNTVINYHHSDVCVEINAINPTLIGLITSLFGLVLGIIIWKDITIKEEDKISILSKKYWIKANQELKKIHNLTVMTMLLALLLVFKMIPIPSGFGTLGISFTYLIYAIIALSYGPIAALWMGLLGDLLGFILFDKSGYFFFGYTFNEMMACFIYAILFYKKRFTFSKVLFSRMIINIIINGILGGIWYGVISKFSSFQQYRLYILTVSLPKNLLYLLPQTFILFMVVKMIMPYLYKNNMVSDYTFENVGIM